MALPYVGDSEPREMPLFQCWDEENAIEDDAKEVRAWDPARAAEAFAERRWDGDYPEEQRICVRDANGELSRFEVHAVQTVDFRARQVEG